MATKKQNRPMKASVVRPGMKKPGSGPKQILPKISTGTKNNRLKPGSGPKKPLGTPKKDITKIPGFKFGRGTE